MLNKQQISGVALALTMLIVSGCADVSVTASNEWYCLEGYKPVGLTDAEAAGLGNEVKVDIIDGNDAVYVETCLD